MRLRCEAEMEACSECQRRGGCNRRGTSVSLQGLLPDTAEKEFPARFIRLNAWENGKKWSSSWDAWMRDVRLSS